MTKKDMVKATAKLIVGFGVGAIVTNAVSFTTPTFPMGTLRRVAIGIGSFVLSACASEKIANYVDEKVDDIFEEVSKWGRDAVIEEA